MLTVWGRRSSFNLQKVMWLIGELGVAHRHTEAGGQIGGLDTPEFRAMNPHGRWSLARFWRSRGSVSSTTAATTYAKHRSAAAQKRPRLDDEHSSSADRDDLVPVPRRVMEDLLGGSESSSYASANGDENSQSENV